MIAARILAWAQFRHKIRVIAAGVNTTLADGAPSFDGMLAMDGITGIPIAVPKTSHVPNGTPPYQTTLRTRAAAVLDPSRVYADAVTVYRQALADSPGNVEIIEVGYLNNLSELLNSPADSISPLTGAQLIAAKVAHVWIMGGDYPSGTENNFNRTAQARAAANNVAANWPTPKTYLGFTVGETVITGGSLLNMQGRDLAAQALIDYGSPSGRSSWDPMLTLAAIVGDPVEAGYTATSGTNVVNASTGANTFTAGAGNDRYLSKSLSDSAFAAIMNSLLLKQNWYTTDPYP